MFFWTALFGENIDVLTETARRRLLLPYGHTHQIDRRIRRPEGDRFFVENEKQGRRPFEVIGICPEVHDRISNGKN